MTTKTQTNEAAERLEPGDMYCDNHSRCEGRDPFRHPGQFIWSLEDDRAAERRATVERIRERLAIADTTPDNFDREVGHIRAILDEEAAR